MPLILICDISIRFHFYNKVLKLINFGREEKFPEPQLLIYQESSLTLLGFYVRHLNVLEVFIQMQHVLFLKQTISKPQLACLRGSSGAPRGLEVYIDHEHLYIRAYGNRTQCSCRGGCAHEFQTILSQSQTSEPKDQIYASTKYQ